LIRDTQAGGKTVAALGTGVAVLARAGVLKGKRATCFMDEKTQALVRAEGAVLVGKDPVVIDRGDNGGFLVTAEKYSPPRIVEQFAEAVTGKVLERADR
jgi:putative intracellular protease/amidase